MVPAAVCGVLQMCKPAVCTSLQVMKYNIRAQERMCSLVNRTKVVVFMRGTERSPAPTCQDSQEVATLLDKARVLWEAVNILKDQNAEMAIREYTGDARMPLIFLGGELLGDLEDLKAAQDSGDLELMFSQIKVKRRKP